MVAKKITSKGYLVLTVIILLFISITTLLLLNTPSASFYLFIRLFALWGYTFLAIATILTPFLKETGRIFGRPFIKIHHIFAFTGLGLITLHPVSYSIETMSASVFKPVFDSWSGFWVNAGRPAIIILYLALIAVLLRKKIKPWRIIHSLMYIVLLMGFVHGNLVGTDFTNTGILIIFSILFGLAIITFVAKRIQIYRIRKRK